MSGANRNKILLRKTATRPALFDLQQLRRWPHLAGRAIASPTTRSPRCIRLVAHLVVRALADRWLKRGPLGGEESALHRSRGGAVRPLWHRRRSLPRAAPFDTEHPPAGTAPRDLVLALARRRSTSSSAGSGEAHGASRGNSRVARAHAGARSSPPTSSPSPPSPRSPGHPRGTRGCTS